MRRVEEKMKIPSWSPRRDLILERENERERDGFTLTNHHNLALREFNDKSIYFYRQTFALSLPLCLVNTALRTLAVFTRSYFSFAILKTYELPKNHQKTSPNHDMKATCQNEKKGENKSQPATLSRVHTLAQNRARVNWHDVVFSRVCRDGNNGNNSPCDRAFTDVTCTRLIHPYLLVYTFLRGNLQTPRETHSTTKWNVVKKQRPIIFRHFISIHKNLFIGFIFHHPIIYLGLLWPTSFFLTRFIWNDIMRVSFVGNKSREFLRFLFLSALLHRYHGHHPSDKPTRGR